jgi:hypothetical protein
VVVVSFVFLQVTVRRMHAYSMQGQVFCSEFGTSLPVNINTVRSHGGREESPERGWPAGEKVAKHSQSHPGDAGGEVSALGLGLKS